MIEISIQLPTNSLGPSAQRQAFDPSVSWRTPPSKNTVAGAFRSARLAKFSVSTTGKLRRS